jgi:hypothetical protein
MKCEQVTGANADGRLAKPGHVEVGEVHHFADFVRQHAEDIGGVRQ